MPVVSCRTLTDVRQGDGRPSPVRRVNARFCAARAMHRAARCRVSSRFAEPGMICFTRWCGAGFPPTGKGWRRRATGWRRTSRRSSRRSSRAGIHCSGSRGSNANHATSPSCGGRRVVERLAWLVPHNPLPAGAHHCPHLDTSIAWADAAQVDKCLCGPGRRARASRPRSWRPSAREPRTGGLGGNPHRGGGVGSCSATQCGSG